MWSTATLLMVLGDWSLYLTPYTGGDLSGDGYVGAADLLIVLGFMVS